MLTDYVCLVECIEINVDGDDNVSSYVGDGNNGSSGADRTSSGDNDSDDNVSSYFASDGCDVNEHVDNSDISACDGAGHRCKDSSPRNPCNDDNLRCRCFKLHHH